MEKPVASLENMRSDGTMARREGRTREMVRVGRERKRGGNKLRSLEWKAFSGLVT